MGINDLFLFGIHSFNLIIIVVTRHSQRRIYASKGVS